MAMPRISEYYGIAIYMYYEDHPPPHFHAIYGDFEAVFGIQTEEILEGKLRALSLVKEWVRLHQGDLLEDWDLAEAKVPLKKILPLP
jgi:Domain of unknown function (DUF4160)